MSLAQSFSFHHTLSLYLLFLALHIICVNVTRYMHHNAEENMTDIFTSFIATIEIHISIEGDALYTFLKILLSEIQKGAA
jgi:hypothetical protein